MYYWKREHCMKSVRILSYSGLHFSAFGLNTERYGVSLRIQSKRGKMRTRITPNMDTAYAVKPSEHPYNSRKLLFEISFHHIKKSNTSKKFIADALLWISQKFLEAWCFQMVSSKAFNIVKNWKYNITP